MRTSRATARRAWTALALALAGCASSESARDSGAALPALAAREAPGVHASIVWQAPGPPGWTAAARALAESDARARLQLDPGDAGGEPEWVELEFEVPLAELGAVLARLSEAAGAGAAAEAELATPGPLDRSTLLGMPAPSGAPRWHAAALAPESEFDAVRRAFASLSSAAGGAVHSAGEPRAAASAGVLVFDAPASLPSEVRWVPASELAPSASARLRAAESVRASALADELRGWTFVPASVDASGAREPACLYTCAELAAAKQRLAELRAALRGPRAVRIPPALLEARVAFARGQLQDERFRLRALHGGELARFEADFAALRALQPEDAGATADPGPGLWSIVGPQRGWSAELAGLGEVALWRAPLEAGDAAASGELERMWSALGGVERWRALTTLRILGVLTPADGTRQGVEQWIDFAGGRFALSQAVRDQETVIAATPSEAWIVDGAQGVDLEPAQAKKFRGRMERAWCTVLRRLAQPARDGLAVALDGERLVVREGARALCWLELGDDGAPSRLGYHLDAEEGEALYEFHDWQLGAPLPYPARTLQVDRGAAIEIQHLEPGAALDPSLWTR